MQQWQACQVYFLSCFVQEKKTSNKQHLDLESAQSLEWNTMGFLYTWNNIEKSEPFKLLTCSYSKILCPNQKYETCWNKQVRRGFFLTKLFRPNVYFTIFPICFPVSPSFSHPKASPSDHVLLWSNFHRLALHNRTSWHPDATQRLSPTQRLPHPKDVTCHPCNLWRNLRITAGRCLVGILYDES